MGSVNNFSEIAMIASIISQNKFEEVRDAGRNGAMYAHDLISAYATEFFNKHEHTVQWEEYCTENGFSDWEECICKFVNQKIKALTL